MLGPVIEGARVRLEPPRPEWGPTYQRWLADTEVTRYLMQRNPQSLRQEEELLEKVAEDPNRVVWGIVLNNGYRQCAVFRRDRYVEGRWHDLWVGEILRGEWAALHPDALQQDT